MIINKVFFYVVVLSVFFLFSCDLESGSYESFDWDLQGTWVSNDPSVYSGTIIITNNKVKISGYLQSQTPENGNDEQRPFKNIPKNVEFKGYSNEGRFYIEEFMAEGIPYQLSIVGDYPYTMLLRFHFNGREEILQKN